MFCALMLDTVLHFEIICYLLHTLHEELYQLQLDNFAVQGLLVKV